jgi:hypothetical protein
MMQQRSIAITIIVSITVAACANGSFRRTVSNNDPVTLWDCRRIAVVIGSEVGKFSRPGLVDPTHITCTEPSPDVAKAVGRAFELALALPT